MRNIIHVVVLFFVCQSAFSQDNPKMLLLDPQVEIECTQAVNDMYNYKFDRAEKQFQILKLKYPDHPLPYFLMGLSTWWKMLPNLNVKDYDDVFIAYMDSSITRAEKLYDNQEARVEAAFFLSGAYGFKAEFYGERNSYAKASFAGKNALKYLLDYKDNNTLSPEFLFGVALYNYYEVWIREEYPLLRPILLFFPNGDQTKGIDQLKEVSQNAFYTRTEAQYELARLYLDSVSTYDDAMELLGFLYQSYPDNPVFEKLYAKAAYYNGMYNKCEQISQDMIQKYNDHLPGYVDYGVRWAYYFLGDIYRSGNRTKAKEYFQKSVEMSENSGATDQGYYFLSLKNLAEIAHEEKNAELEKEYYKKLKKVIPKSDKDYKTLRKEAKRSFRQKEKEPKATK